MIVTCKCGWKIHSMQAGWVACGQCGLSVEIHSDSTTTFHEPEREIAVAFCECGYFATVAVSMDVTCPLCQRVFRVESKEDQGRAAWAALHSVVNPTPEWYAAWLETVPSFGCSCRANWDALTKDKPPDYANFAQWAIDRHNDVNKKLGKPIWHPTKSSDKPSM